MAKKFEIKNNQTTIVLSEPYRLYTVMAAKAIVPHEAIDPRWFRVNCRTDRDYEVWDNARFVTNEGKTVRLSFVSSWNNTDGQFNIELEILCRNYYDMSFETVKSRWEARFGGRISNCWHQIKMEEVND